MQPFGAKRKRSTKRSFIREVWCYFSWIVMYKFVPYKHARKLLLQSSYVDASRRVSLWVWPDIRYASQHCL